ncbi:ABC transporter ATP-binding protein [Chitinimonas taiwanensis]|jgi:multiple sugar transport system ATP-binding protein|uniref:Multiple sugar transport system ATP-binding protein n=1 Tax=Chitinimonas taiwanensis DSM 18899 TaxID=1121279 RepID=A0A1K2HMH9_9NEIS|nr:sn-glycerol-3-phosphate ABC transporter ATP-binding protein UgpC [Chitinimonas taiwanensis]SFZ77901.1 multiple sugar transport system ATP-binding protein [Chitinimonas taiwanensis DSM 18899]
MSDVVLRGIRKSFGEIETLHGIDLDIKDGEFVVFVGPSGCGKSTLLRTIAGLEDITSGDLHIGGERCNDVPPAKRGVAMVFQSYALYPHMTVAENMAFGLKLAGVSKDEMKQAVDRAAKILQIEHLLERKPKALSGGQRQRVAIGRAIVRKPNVFLFDEPLSNLDAALRVQMRIEITKLHRELKTTMIYVTHDQVEAMTLADRIVVLSAGNVEQVGAPLELYHHPRNLFVAGFIGSPKMNFIQGTLLSGSETLATVKLADGAQVQVQVDASRGKVGSAVTLGIRPEHFVVDAQGNKIAGQVIAAEHLGEATIYYVHVEGAQDHLVVRAHAEHDAKAGETLHVGAAPSDCYLFDDAGLAFQRVKNS